MPRSLIPLILAGGAGTRLWPLSRESVPKPFMALPDGDTLLAKTARRAMRLQGVSTLATITNLSYYRHAADVYAGLGVDAPSEPVFLLEPFGRNTAPAIALGAIWARARGYEDSVLLVLPSDHLIRDLAAFEKRSSPQSNWRSKDDSSPSGSCRRTRTRDSATSNAAPHLAMRPGEVRRCASRVDSSRSPDWRRRRNMLRPEITSGTPACSRSRRARFWRRCPAMRRR